MKCQDKGMLPPPCSVPDFYRDRPFGNARLETRSIKGTTVQLHDGDFEPLTEEDFCIKPDDQSKILERKRRCERSSKRNAPSQIEPPLR